MPQPRSPPSPPHQCCQGAGSEHRKDRRSPGKWRFARSCSYRVMRALEEQGLQVSFVAGTSMGAFIGSVFAAGNLQRLATDFLVFDWRQVAGLLDPCFLDPA